MNLFQHMEPFLIKRYRALNEAARFTYCFYSYYFLEIANKKINPIEFYFHPKTRRNPEFKNKKEIRSTVTQKYLRVLCSSKKFVKDLKLYITQCIREEVLNDIIIKLIKTCREWEKLYKTKGQKQLLEILTKRYQDNPRCKLAWGIQQVDFALKKMKNKINKLTAFD